jgi:hypothetical protein
MAARAQAIPVRAPWHVAWWRVMLLALVAAAAIVTAILTLRAGPAAGTDPGRQEAPATDFRPAGGYDLGGGVVCHQCL